MEALMLGDDASPLRIDNLLREGVEWIDQVLINEKVLEEEITEGNREQIPELNQRGGKICKRLKIIITLM
jgi:hypothetical protein